MFAQNAAKIERALALEAKLLELWIQSGDDSTMAEFSERCIVYGNGRVMMKDPDEAELVPGITRNRRTGALSFGPAPSLTGDPVRERRRMEQLEHQAARERARLELDRAVAWGGW